jgi:hypothetical protein
MGVSYPTLKGLSDLLVGYMVSLFYRMIHTRFTVLVQNEYESDA